MLGDDIVDNKKPCLKQMMEVYSQYKTSILGVQQVPQSDVCKYGIVDGRLVEDRIYKVRELVEKLSGTVGGNHREVRIAKASLWFSVSLFRFVGSATAKTKRTGKKDQKWRRRHLRVQS